MGANLSAYFSDYPEEASQSQSKPGLGDLPEGCVAAIIGYLDPPQICKLAKLNRAFRGASRADFVWETKLPPNYLLLVKEVLGVFPENLGKRDIYARLCGGTAFDGSSKKVWLDKNTAGVCMAISSKGLRITGIDDRRYWSHINTEESSVGCIMLLKQTTKSTKFSSVAYLQQTWWFEVDGEVEFPFPVGTYSVFFRLQLGRTSRRFGHQICNTEHVHGWDIKPARFQLWASGGQYASSQCTLEEPGRWIHYHVGDFSVANSNQSTKVKFSMIQIDCTHTKGGLCVDSVVIYPSQFRGRLKDF